MNMEKRYYSANEFFRNKFGDRVIKVALNAGFTCPNRDGTKGTGGCIFCSGRGSGDFAGSSQSGIREQFYEGRKIMNRKWRDGLYMAYFQAFTNTYAPVDTLRRLYGEAVEIPEVCALSIATRPDCIDESKASLISEINRIKYTCVEMGLQSSKEDTARLINRCYENSCFEKSVRLLKEKGIDVIAHIILGLPGESREDMLESVRFAAECGISGIKLQLLHVLKGTKLAQMYEAGKFRCLEYEEYVDIVVRCIEILPPDVVVHRITGDGKGQDLIAPLYSKNKKKVLNGINREFVIRNTYQGRKWQGEADKHTGA